MSIRLTTPSRPCSRTRPRLGRRARPLSVAACAVLLVSGDARPPPWAVSTRDLIELSKAGLGDEVLVALIEADGTVFNLDAPKILELRAAGVSERVITAMIRNALTRRRAQACRRRRATRGRARAVIAIGGRAEQDGAPYFVVIGEKAPATSANRRRYRPCFRPGWIAHSWSGVQRRRASRGAHLPSRRRHIPQAVRTRSSNDGWAFDDSVASR